MHVGNTLAGYDRVNQTGTHGFFGAREGWYIRGGGEGEERGGGLGV